MSANDNIIDRMALGRLLCEIGIAGTGFCFGAMVRGNASGWWLVGAVAAVALFLAGSTAERHFIGKWLKRRGEES